MILDAANAAFMQGSVSIVASSRNSDNLPSLARCVGCRLSSDRKLVTLLVPKSRALELLDAVKISHQIAVVFSEPSTHRTIQLKGNDAEVGPAQKKDTKISKDYADAFVGEVCPMGYCETAIRALVTSTDADLQAISFHPCDAFLQTPGPRAGEPLVRP
jgi:hypothetical protein